MVGLTHHFGRQQLVQALGAELVHELPRAVEVRADTEGQGCPPRRPNKTNEPSGARAWCTYVGEGAVMDGVAAKLGWSGSGRGERGKHPQRRVWQTGVTIPFGLQAYSPEMFKRRHRSARGPACQPAEACTKDVADTPFSPFTPLPDEMRLAPQLSTTPTIYECDPRTRISGKNEVHTACARWRFLLLLGSDMYSENSPKLMLTITLSPVGMLYVGALSGWRRSTWNGP